MNTVLIDDPQLTVRAGKVKKQPLRVILDSALRTPPTAKVAKKGTLICTLFGSSPERRRQLEAKKVEVLELPDLSLRTVLLALGRKESNSVLIEGGSKVATSALEENLVDHLCIFIAPKLIGGEGAKTFFEGYGVERMDSAIQLKNVSLHQFGKEVCIEGDLS